MKKKILYLLMILFVEMHFISCSKSKNLEEPEPPGKDFKYKVIEYQTNVPISSAQLEFSNCTPLILGPGCSNSRIVGTWYSDTNGEIFIKNGTIPGSFNMVNFSKDNYWSKGNADNVISTQTGDILVVRLFPYSWLKIHMKNEISHGSAVNIKMRFNVVFDSIHNGDSPTQFFVHSVNNLDTTVIYKTFGNIKNIVEASLDSFGIMQQVYSKTQFVNKNDTLNWEILLR